MVNIPEFSDAQWTELVERLTLHADAKLRKLYWRGVSAKRGGTPPGAVCAADLAAEAITDFIDEKRSWNRDKQPDLFRFLMGVVDSKVNHLAESLENRATRRLDASDGKVGPAYRVKSPQPGPDTLVANDEQLTRFRAAMIDGLDGDDLAGEIFECLDADITKPSEMAELLGTTITEVNNAQKRLRRIADKVCTKLGKAKR